MSKFKEVEEKLQVVVEMYSSYFNKEKNTIDGIIDRIAFYEKHKEIILKDFNEPIDKFLAKNEAGMETSERQEFNSIVRKYERRLIYGGHTPPK
jgi:hypothetical protein